MRRVLVIESVFFVLLLACPLALAQSGGDVADTALQAGDKLLDSLPTFDENLLGERWFGVYMNDYHIGWGWQKVEKSSVDDKDVYVTTSEIRMKILDELEMTMSGSSTLRPNLTLVKRSSKEFGRKSRNQKPEEESIEIVLENGTYVKKATKASDTSSTLIETKGPVVSDMLLVVRKLPLTEGGKFAFRVIDDETEGKNTLARATVEGKRACMIAGKEQQAIKINWRHSDGTTSEVYVDANGNPLQLVKTDPATKVFAVTMSKEEAQKVDEIVFKPTTAEEAQKDGAKTTVAMLFGLLGRQDSAAAEKLFDMPAFAENTLKRRGVPIDKTNETAWKETVALFSTKVMESMMENSGDMPGPIVFMVSMTESVKDDKALVSMGEKFSFALEKQDGLWKITDMPPAGKGEPDKEGEGEKEQDEEE